MSEAPAQPLHRATDAPEQRSPSLSARVAGQGLIVIGGHIGAQALSFARNAILAHWLSKGDFGIAAAIVMLLQIVDTLSDVGADRLILQAEDGDNPRLVATAHATLIARGFITAIVILALAYPMAVMLGVPQAAWAFAVVAVVPAIKGFMHLDSRRAQRQLNNRPQMLIELAPQIVSALLVVPALLIVESYAAIVLVTFGQALAALAVSHLLAERRYAISLERQYLDRLIAFGWPIWASAFPLVAVYQGDRMLIGAFLGVEALASYTAAFMLTMVPALVAGKLSQSLMLPLLAEARRDIKAFRDRFAIMAEATIVMSAVYLAGFLVAGPTVLELAFGKAYAGLDAVVALLSLMWSLRMAQAVAGMAIMAQGETRPLLLAGLVRAGGLLLAFIALATGHGLVGAAAASAASETISMLYMLRCLEHSGTGAGMPGLGTLMLRYTLLLVPTAALALPFALEAASGPGLGHTAVYTMAALVALTLAAPLGLPQLRRRLMEYVVPRLLAPRGRSMA
ncbi:MAG: oligosaccharide flippase family protein [Hyphomicrobiaceae bacterium]